jgi:hypothetical protein
VGNDRSGLVSQGTLFCYIAQLCYTVLALSDLAVSGSEPFPRQVCLAQFSPSPSSVSTWSPILEASATGQTRPGRRLCVRLLQPRTPRQRTRKRLKAWERGAGRQCAVWRCIACGSSGCRPSPFECLASLRFDFRFSLAQFDKQARAPRWVRTPLRPVPFAGVSKTGARGTQQECTLF